MRSFPLLFAALILGCRIPDGGYAAPPGSSISITPSTVEVSGAYYATHDLVGTILYVDVLVAGPVETTGGTPLEGVKVEGWSTLNEGVYFQDMSNVTQETTPPAIPDGSSREDCYDEAGNVVIDDERPWCAWFQDSLTGTYYDLSGTYGYGDASKAFTANKSEQVTDSFGHCRFHIVVDYLSIDSIEYEDSTDTAGSDGSDGSDGTDEGGGTEEGGSSDGGAPPPIDTSDLDLENASKITFFPATLYFSIQVAEETLVIESGG
jgi:hypothetical protein